MTPREVQWRIDAIVQEHNRQMRLVAQLAAWVLTPFSSKAVKADDFISRPGLKDPKAALREFTKD